MFGRRQNPSASFTYVGVGSHFQGDLRVDGNLRLDGAVYGDVLVKGDVEIAADGAVEGSELSGHNIVIHGQVKARVVATGKLSLSRSAHVEGDITATALDMEAGAFYVGHIATAQPQALPGTQPSLSLAGSSVVSPNGLGSENSHF
ncbi:bactofilin family protein [Almyronema epifaneia]|uniref:Polymer-forming cytoskeletal protein n=1 Tax=Almyronema epifaneia S1 TaxID=2991925 RepID=A0ABW6I9C9_9CYAN